MHTENGKFESKFENRIEKNKNRVVRAIFGRAILLFSSLILQVLMLLAFMSILANYFFVYYWITIIVVVLFVAHIMNSDQNPAYKLSWIVPIALVPIFGVFFYAFLHIQFGTRQIGKRLEILITQTKPYLMQDENVMEKIKSENIQVAGMFNYLNDFAGFPAYRNTEATYFPIGEAKFESMLIELKKAEKFIFLEYFIVDDGIMLRAVLEILAQKAKEGVEIRFMYDGMCTLSTVPPTFPSKLRKLGIKCKVFAPIRPALSTSQNHRDHRKILVIDGKVAYTGGVNIADEYINKKERYGHWKDTAVMVKGEAVRSFTIMFLQNWNVSETGIEDYSKYIVENQNIVADGYVVPYGDSPYDDEEVGEAVYMDVINNATKYVHIMTPYLILDNEMLKALEYAAKRGVDVKIIGPHKTDKPSAYLIARTYYEKLIRRGVKIYEYTPGFVHAKVFTSDNTKAVVGTINLDFRSLYLNFECASYFYKHKVVNDVEKDFDDTLSKCQEITLEDCRKYSKIKTMVGKLLYIFAPLM